MVAGLVTTGIVGLTATAHAAADPVTVMIYSTDVDRNAAVSGRRTATVRYASVCLPPCMRMFEGARRDMTPVLAAHPQAHICEVGLSPDPGAGGAAATADCGARVPLCQGRVRLAPA